MADTELAEVADFLSRHAPFDALPEAVRRALPRRMTSRYYRRGSRLMSVGADSDDLYLVRSGAIEIRDADGGLVRQGAEGTTAGSTTLVGGNPSRFDVVAMEDTLALHLPAEVFHELSGQFPDFADHFDMERTDRLRGGAARSATVGHGEMILRTSAREIARRAPITVTPGTSIRQAAQVMTAEAVSSLLVVDGTHIVGILTDRDIRRRVVAEGADSDGPVSGVMTRDPAVADADSPALELLLTMTEANVHHLPIVEGGQPVGMVTTTDLMRLERASAVYIVGDVAKQADVAGVAAVAARLPRIVDQLVDQDVSAGDITRLVTAVGDAVERRLLTLAESELVAEGHGPPPDYCWMVLGSKARHEQALGSDQDHAVIIADDAPEGAEDWVAALAERVVAGLEAAGYPRCDGDVMATNPRWRMRLAGWRREFQQWIHEPVADAVLTASIFFDSRPLHGNRALHETLDEEVIRRAPDGAIFLAHLTKQAVLNEPPLGFFRGFVLAKAGEHKDTLDLKRGGIGAIVDLARVHALGHGLTSVSTRSRLLAAGRAGAMSESMAASLVDALELISHARLQHQARQAAAGVQPDSWVSPTELSPLQQRSLRAAFQTVRRAQQQLAQRYPAQHFS